MWLLDTETLELHEFIGDEYDFPEYAILSHVWVKEEVTFTEMRKPKHREAARRKTGYAKIVGCCAQAVRDGYEWAWIDSCCIDKRSSAELSEAINSMWNWYARSGHCYVYLADVKSADTRTQDFKASRWFTRGWTLQELLAPKYCEFFDAKWTPIGTLQHHHQYPDLTEEVSVITGIPADFLKKRRHHGAACIAHRMFWASARETTRPEDQAYSLMGLFDVSMPILYGEGLHKAFHRLQQTIISQSNDQSILAWYSPQCESPDYRLLASSPADFKNSGLVYVMVSAHYKAASSATNVGLRITLRLANDDMSREWLKTDYLRPGSRMRVMLNCTESVKMSDGAAGIGSIKDSLFRTICLTVILTATDPEGLPVFSVFRPSKGFDFATVLSRGSDSMPVVYKSMYLQYR